ncbi:MAG: DNA-directed DNA polymerase II small subunit [Euryarchaeota archaeon]|nr:DNA-directed DNA polymerase II small subunit [Euryarchaeota archaeon]
MQEIVRRFAEEGYLIDPDALEMIGFYPGSKEALIKNVMENLDPSTLVVSASDIRSAEIGPARAPSCGELSGARPSPPPRPRVLFGGEPDGRSWIGPSPVSGDVDVAVIEREKSSLRGGRRIPDPVNHPSPGPHQSSFSSASDNLRDVEVLSDITGRSTCVGEYKDFVRYFRDRYGKIREMLSARLNARPIESLGKSAAGREISIAGMVMDLRTSARGNRIVELEDPTGMVTVVFQKGSSAFEQAASLVTDEVIGVTGTTDGGRMVFATSLIWPDIQSQSTPIGEGGALLSSDLHVGSRYFMEEAWERFVSWINGEVDDPHGLASAVRYLVIAGDLVDGIGIYPGQEADLAIKDVQEQYELAAELLAAIPKRVRIVISPGNHDAVRQAEPQPALFEPVQDLFGDNVSFLGNPAWFRLGGVDWLVYHGRSIDDLVLKIPGLSYDEPEKVMTEMLKRRHLSPIYGNRVSIAPEREDLLVIQKPPAILHCGHVHTMGITRYKGVTVVNSGTWQSQTDFQKKMNIQPVPGIVPHIDLKTMRVRKLIFA